MNQLDYNKDKGENMTDTLTPDPDGAASLADDTCEVGNPDAYDGLAVASIDFDADLFPEDDEDGEVVEVD